MGRRPLVGGAFTSTGTLVPWSTWVAFHDDGGIGELGGGILKYDGFVASLLVIAMRLCDELDEPNNG